MPVLEQRHERAPQLPALHLQSAARDRDTADVQVRIRFDTGDDTYQGFRGVGIDNFSVSDVISAVVPGRLRRRCAAKLDVRRAERARRAVLAGAHESADHQRQEPRDQPRSRDAAGRRRAAAAARHGDHYAWFGNIESGTFCGPDFALRGRPRPRRTRRITSGPPASTASNDATFTFTASEPTSSSSARSTAAPSRRASRRRPTRACPRALTPSRCAQPTSPATSTPPRRPTPGRSGRPGSSDLDNPTLGVDVNVAGDWPARFWSGSRAAARARREAGAREPEGRHVRSAERGAPDPGGLVPRHAQGHGSPRERRERARQAPARHLPQGALPGPPVEEAERARASPTWCLKGSSFRALQRARQPQVSASAALSRAHGPAPPRQRQRPLPDERAQQRGDRARHQVGHHRPLRRHADQGPARDASSSATSAARRTSSSRPARATWRRRPG